MNTKQILKIAVSLSMVVGTGCSRKPAANAVVQTALGAVATANRAVAPAATTAQTALTGVNRTNLAAPMQLASGGPAAPGTGGGSFSIDAALRGIVEDGAPVSPAPGSETTSLVTAPGPSVWVQDQFDAAVRIQGTEHATVAGGAAASKSTPP